MKHLQRLLCYTLTLTLLLTATVGATDNKVSNTLHELTQVHDVTYYAESIGIDLSNSLSTTWSSVQLGTDIASPALAECSADCVSEIPAVTVVTQNQDGSLTSSSYVILNINNDNSLSSAISKSTSGSYYEAKANSGFVFRFDATYDKQDMSTYGYSGYAFAPKYSKLTVKSSTAYGYPSDLNFHILLHGQYSANASNPASRSDEWPSYSKTRYIGTPTLDSQYSYYEYTSYSSEYSGKLVHISSGGEGCYMLKCEFTYNGTDHFIKTFIYNGSDENV